MLSGSKYHGVFFLGGGPCLGFRFLTAVELPVLKGGLEEGILSIPFSSSFPSNLFLLRKVLEDDVVLEEEEGAEGEEERELEEKERDNERKA